MSHSYSPVYNKYIYQNWLSQFPWHVAFTMNMRANISKSAAQSAAQYFWHKLDCDTFGCTQVKKHKARLVRACFIEGETGVRNFHYHAVVQLPVMPYGSTQSHDERVARFGEMLKLRWEQLDTSNNPHVDL